MLSKCVYNLVVFVLDFMISHMPITGFLNNEEETIRLVEGALMTLFRKDFASFKKFFTWFIGHLDMEEEDVRPDKKDPAIKAAIQAIKRLFKKFEKV